MHRDCSKALSSTASLSAGLLIRIFCKYIISCRLAERARNVSRLPQLEVLAKKLLLHKVVAVVSRAD